MEFSLDQYPETVQSDLRAIADEAIALGGVSHAITDKQSSVEVVSGLPGEPFASARGHMVLRILRHHQDEEV